MVRAVRALQPGGVLGWNYGPRELLMWPLAKRREYMLRKHGFICCCPRCASEDQVVLAPLHADARTFKAPCKAFGNGRLWVEFYSSQHKRLQVFPRCRKK